MFLANTEIKTLLPKLDIKTPEDKYAFSSDTQLKGYSIVLRLGQLFWRQKRGKRTIDLRLSHLLTISPKEWWVKDRKKKLNLKDPLTIKPLELVLGQTFEMLTIPEGVVASVVTNPYYARLGLQVTCARDFIFPGWRGALPLEIINNSIHDIALYPLLPVCRIMFSPLTAIPEKEDGVLASELFSDEGGPFYWWRDHLAYQLNERVKRKKIKKEDVVFLKEKLRTLNGEGVFRFDRFLFKKPFDIEFDVERMVQKFCKKERFKKLRESAYRIFRMGLFPILFIASITALLMYVHQYMQYGIFTAMLISLYPGIKAATEQKTIYYTQL